MTHRRRIGAIVAVFAIADLVIATLLDLRENRNADLWLAFATAQVAMLAVWSGLGRHNCLMRFGIGLPAACLVSATFTVRTDDVLEFLMLLMIVGVWFVLVTALSTVRTFYGWRFICVDVDEARSHKETKTAKQFRIRQIFGVTTMIAVVLAVARALVGNGAQDNGFLYVFATMFALHVLFTSVGAIPVVWALLCDTWLVWWVAAAVFTILWTFGEAALFNAITQSSSSSFITLSACQFVTLSIGMGCLRLDGGRLRRVNEIDVAVHE